MQIPTVCSLLSGEAASARLLGGDSGSQPGRRKRRPLRPHALMQGSPCQQALSLTFSHEDTSSPTPSHTVSGLFFPFELSPNAHSSQYSPGEKRHHSLLGLGLQEAAENQGFRKSFCGTPLRAPSQSEVHKLLVLVEDEDAESCLQSNMFRNVELNELRQNCVFRVASFSCRKFQSI